MAELSRTPESRSRRARRLRSAGWILAVVVLAVTTVTVAGNAGRVWTRTRLEQALTTGWSQDSKVVEIEPWIPGCTVFCEGGYFDYLDRHRGERRTISPREIQEQFAEMDAATGMWRQHLDAETLQWDVRRALAIEGLLDGIAERPLLVATLEESSSQGVTQRRILFGDPEVGSFEALLLLPSQLHGSTLWPAVVGLHGHRDTAATFAEENMGRALAAHGFAVLIPEFRAHDCGLSETLLSLDLLENGHTLLGLKVYETLLMVEYLNTLDNVDAARIGLLAHSGGSTVADLAVRLSDQFRAKVIDLTIDYRDRCGPLGTHCQTVPDLFPLAGDLAAEDDLEIATLSVPYDFQAPGIQHRIVDFFERSLATPGGSPESTTPDGLSPD